MIIRVFDDKRAEVCDGLLTKLIQDERQYNKFIDEKFIVKDYFKNVIKDDNNILLCYEEDNLVVGYVFLKQVVCDDVKGYLIDGLFVEKEYRNRGIATKLLKESLNIVKDKDICFVDVGAMAENKTSLNLYKSLGFKEFKINLRIVYK